MYVSAKQRCGWLVSLDSSNNCKEKEGLTQFLNEDFLYDWKGFAVWDAGNGTVDCHYEARIIVKPTKAVSEDKELARLLTKNPFTTKEKIRDLFARRLQDYLDHEFDYYCTCEDYNQPVVEDFEDNLEYDVKQWSEKNGFEFVSCDGDGSLVYQDGDRLLWLIGTDIDKNTEVIFHIHTNEPEKLPERRVQYGFDNRGFRVGAERADNEMTSIDHYRVFEKEIPEEYHVTAIVVGFNTDGTVTWNDSFRIE